MYLWHLEQWTENGFTPINIEHIAHDFKFPVTLLPPQHVLLDNFFLVYEIAWPNKNKSKNYFQKHNNAFKFSEHVSMFQTSSSAIMNICKDLQKWSVYITTHIQ